MPRPRKYVRINGVEYTGVSLHKPSGRYYIYLQADRKRRYFHTPEEARAAYLTLTAVRLTDYERTVMEVVARVRSAAAVEKLRELHLYDTINSSARIEGGVIPGGEQAFFSHIETANALADSVGVPQMHATVQEVSPKSPGSRKLWAVFEEWKRLKRLAGREERYLTDNDRVWKRFVRVVGNIGIAELTGSSFKDWREHVMKESPRRRSPANWASSMHGRVGLVFRAVKRHNPDWPWPAGITDWIDAWERCPFRPKPSNRQPIPVEAYQDLIRAADRWAQTDPSQFDGSTQAGRAKRRQAAVRRRMGVRMKAILALTLNCGLDPIDVERLRCRHLKLKVDPPHLDLPRKKIQHALGEEVDRRTPLLPSTVAAINRWLDFEATSSDLAFRSAAGGPLSTTHLGRNFRKLANEAGVDKVWSVKHLRNVGPTTAKRAGLPRDMRDAFLGHAVDGTSKFYEGDLDETYLITLVNEIGRVYGDGEKVGRQPTREDVGSPNGLT